MTSEISSTTVATPAPVTPGPTSTTAAPLAAAVRSAAATGELLNLLQPDTVLDTGQSAPAQVLTLKQAGQAAFEVLLQITLASGRQTTVQTTTSQPLLPNTQLTVTQLTPSTLAIIAQQAKGDATLTQLDTQQLPVGSLLQGKVVTSQQVNPGVYRSLVTLLNTSLVGQTLSLESPRPLRVGSLLSAQVQGSQQLNFVPLSGRLDQLALAQQLAGQQTRQGSLQGLLATLSAMYAQPSATPQATSAPVQATVDALLASLPDIDAMTDPKTVAAALQGSGVFLEANLLAGQPAVPDLKTSLLRLVAQLGPALPAGSSFNPAAMAVQMLAQGLPGYVRSALGMLGQVGQAGVKPQPVGFPLPSRLLQSSEDEDDLEHLLRLASAAISRLQSHQLSSLEQTGVNAHGQLQTTWQMEIPMRNLQDIVPLQVRIQREDRSEEQDAPSRENGAQNAPKEKIWRLDLAFDLDPLGPLQVQAQLFAGSVSSELWAERPGTAQLIAAQLGSLRDRLRACGLNVSELHCHQGTPPQGPRTHLEQRWVDETA